MLWLYTCSYLIYVDNFHCSLDFMETFQVLVLVLLHRIYRIWQNIRGKTFVLKVENSYLLENFIYIAN